MLARVAENVYWLARYLERAENTARLISVNTNLLLDLPAGYTPGWQPLIDITGSRETFDSRGGRADERSIVQFLIADPDNPGSIASSLKMARENGRSLRDVLPTARGSCSTSSSSSLPSSCRRRSASVRASTSSSASCSPRRRSREPSRER